MTKQDILHEFLCDPITLKKLNLTADAVKKIRFGAKTNKKLIAVIKETIEGEYSEENHSTITRKIHNILNQNDLI